MSYLPDSQPPFLARPGALSRPQEALPQKGLRPGTVALSVGRVPSGIVPEHARGAVGDGVQGSSPDQRHASLRTGRDAASDLARIGGL